MLKKSKDVILAGIVNSMYIMIKILKILSLIIRRLREFIQLEICAKLTIMIKELMHYIIYQICKGLYICQIIL